MSLKKWLQKHEVFDKELLTLFPKYGVKDPEKDLKNLTPDQWKEIQATVQTNRAKNLKDNAAKLRLEKKLTKVEKLWRAKRPKKKKKAPKLLAIFDDTNQTSNANAAADSPNAKKQTNAKKKSKKNTDAKRLSVKKENVANDTVNNGQANDPSDTNNDATDTANDAAWVEQDDTLRLSDDDEEANDSKETNNVTYIPTLAKNESVVDALMAGPNGSAESAAKIEPNGYEKEEMKDLEVNDGEDEWERYDDLERYDEETVEEKTNQSNGPSLFVPLVPLKTQGSVVDMLMEGPYASNKEKKKEIPFGVVVSSVDDAEEESTTNSATRKKDYKMMVSSSDVTEDGTKKNEHSEIRDDNNDGKVKGIKVSLDANTFVYNESKNTYSVSLSGCKLLLSDFVNGTMTFEIDGEFVDLEMSGTAERAVDDKYIETVLDEIHQNNPDTEVED